MSRIQDILARAERDGTARRTQTSPSLVPPAADVRPPDFSAPEIDGTSALHRAPFMPAADPMAMTTPVATAVAPTAVEVRTANAVLHPALIAAIAPHSVVAEQYRSIRTRISQHEEHGSLRTVL